MRLTSEKVVAAEEKKQTHRRKSRRRDCADQKKLSAELVGANPARGAGACPAPALDRLAVLPARCLAVRSAQARGSRGVSRGDVGHGRRRGRRHPHGDPLRRRRKSAGTAHSHPSGYRCVYPDDRRRDRQKRGRAYACLWKLASRLRWSGCVYMTSTNVI